MFCELTRLQRVLIFTTTYFKGCEKNLVLLAERLLTEHFYGDLFLFNGIYEPTDIKNIGDQIPVLRRVQYEYIEK